MARCELNQKIWAVVEVDKIIVNRVTYAAARKAIQNKTVNPLMRSQGEPIHKNLITKKVRGVYKTELAIKLAMYLMENAAKKYAREFGGTWNDMFNVPIKACIVTSAVADRMTKQKENKSNEKI